MIRTAAFLALVLLTPLARGADPSPSVTFEQHVRPILKTHCFDCHGEGEKLRGGLDLRLRRLIVEGGESGAAVVAGKHDASKLFVRIQNGEMPPGKRKLTAAEVAVIGRWIDQGAKTAAAEPAKLDRGALITAEDRAFWAFQPIHRPALPSIKDITHVRNEIDVFLLAKLEAKGLAFSPEADRRTLIRRVYFDLLGLPPSPEEVEAALSDKSPDWYERIVDHLLASPHYGERWGRHWLDVAGYADSDGATSEDRVRLWAWKYRDYVIRSLNADKPFDEFIREQLAGDEMVTSPPTKRTPADVEKLIATGFLRTVPDGTGLVGVDEPLARNQVVADTVKVVSSSLLGLTLDCARCHNHRYDPLPQADYYHVRAFFEPAYDPKNWRVPAQRLVSLYTDADRAAAAKIEADAARIDAERLKKQGEYIEQTFQKELAKLPENMRDMARAARTTADAKRSPEQKTLLMQHPSLNVSPGSLYLYDSKAAADLKTYADKAAALRATKPPEEFVAVMNEVSGKAPATHVFHRGDHEQPKEVVRPAGLSIINTIAPLQTPPDNPAAPSTGRRLAFARWLTDGKNPLTARVLVNRVWMHHFGRGIVATPADFGILGERPTHPELLDWLAADFVANGWSLKHLHRQILLTTAYRQSSRREPGKERVDPENRLLGRMNVRRLEAEALRDSLLAVSGTINAKPYGKPIPLKTDEVGQIVVGVENKDSAGYETGKLVLGEREEFRRTVYVQVRRSQPLTVTEAFDAPLLEPNCEVRTSATVAPQSLMLMNNAFVVSQAEAMARRVRAEAGIDLRGQVTHAWRLAFGRDPEETDVAPAMGFLKEQTAVFAKKTPTDPKAPKQDPAQQALASFCHALVSSNGFLYVD